MKKIILRRIGISFSISAVSGLLVNLLIDVILNMVFVKPFIGMPPEYVAYFKTPVMAAYVNVLIYGLIGATFAGMTFLFELDRLGFVIQCLLYYLSTGIVMTFVMIFVWQLHKYPSALLSTIIGYLLTYVIVTLCVIRDAKNNIAVINESIDKANE